MSMNELYRRRILVILLSLAMILSLGCFFSWADDEATPVQDEVTVTEEPDTETQEEDTSLNEAPDEVEPEEQAQPEEQVQPEDAVLEPEETADEESDAVAGALVSKTAKSAAGDNVMTVSCGDTVDIEGRKSFTFNNVGHVYIKNVTSSDPSVVKVSSVSDTSCTCYAYDAEGTAILTVTGDNGTSCTITVNVTHTKPTIDPDLLDSNGNICIELGDNLYVSKPYISVDYASAECSDDDIALVTRFDSSSFYIDTINTGETTLTLTAENGAVNTYKVVVEKHRLLDCPEKIKIPVQAYYCETGAVINKSKYAKDITGVVSSNPKLVDINDDYFLDYDYHSSVGIDVVALKTGTATLTFTFEDGKTETLDVIVETAPIDIKGGKSIALNAGNNKYIYADYNYSGFYKGDQKGYYDYDDYYYDDDDYDTDYAFSYTSSNNKVVAIKPNDDYEPIYYLHAVSPGTAKITVMGDGGSKTVLTVKVTTTADYLRTKSSINKIIRYKGTITGKTAPYASVSAKVAGKSYKATANGTGKYTVKIPKKAAGTIVTLKYSSGGKSYTKKGKIVSNTKITTSNTYSNSKSVTGTATNVRKGDIIQIKIGKKIYKHKVTRTTSKYKFKIKIKKPKKYAIKKTTTIKQSNGYKLGQENDWVYACYKIKKGYTKKQVEWSTYWGDPDDTSSSSGGWSYWYYDDGSYIAFKSGKVKYWYDAD